VPASNAGALVAAHEDRTEVGRDAVISVSGLVKRYGDVEAVRGID
jgi:hypothetical protein